MRFLLVGFLLLWTCALEVVKGEEAGNQGNASAPVKRSKTKQLVKPSFVPYCVTRDVCKPVCDCALFENCDILDMNAEVRNRILIALNQARSIQTKGEPQASGMPMLLYDLHLEEISKCWSARCENEYSECFRTPEHDETTQTVGLLPLDLKVSDLPLEYWDRTIQIWLGEVKKTTAEVVSSLPAGQRGEDVHSYSQILADRILRVGCAWSRSSPTGEQSSVVFVCTFAPRGPRQGESIYRSGKACTTCPEGYSCDYKRPFEFLCKEKSQVEASEPEEAQSEHPADGSAPAAEEGPGDAPAPRSAHDKGDSADDFDSADYGAGASSTEAHHERSKVTAASPTSSATIYENFGICTFLLLALLIQ